MNGRRSNKFLVLKAFYCWIAHKAAPKDRVVVGAAIVDPLGACNQT